MTSTRRHVVSRQLELFQSASWRRMYALICAAAGRLTPRRVWHYPMICLFMAYALYAVSMATGDFPFDRFGSPFATDFSAKITAGRMVLDGELEQLYQPLRQSEVQQEILDHQDPTFLNIYIAPAVGAYMYAPFALFSYFPAAVLWIIVSIGIFVVALRRLWPLLPGLHGVSMRRVGLVGFSAAPVIECIQAGQDALVSLLLLVIATRALLSRADYVAGAAIGLGMYKPQLFLLWAVLLIAQRRWRALGAYTAVAGALAAISIASVGLQGVRDHINLLTSDLYMFGLVDSGGWNMQSLPALVREVLPTRYWTVTNALFLLAGGVGIWRFVERYRAGSGRGGERAILLYASVVLITMLVSPHMFLYDYSIALLPALVLLAHSPSAGTRVAVAALYVLLAISPMLYILANRLPTAFHVIDTQWSLVPVAALLYITWRRLGQPAAVPGRPPGTLVSARSPWATATTPAAAP